jgi:chemotaxis signal transduction protein
MSSENGQQALLQRRKERYRKKKKIVDNSGEECLLFRRGELNYGIPLTALKELKRLSDGWTHIPGVSKIIRGVTSVSGRITAIHDLAAFNDEPAEDDFPYLIVTEYSEYGWLGLACDEVERIEHLNLDTLRSLPLHLSEYSECYSGMTEGDRLIINLNGLIDNETFFKA